VVGSAHFTVEDGNVCKAFGYYRNSDVDHLYAFLMRALKQIKIFFLLVLVYIWTA